MVPRSHARRFRPHHLRYVRNPGNPVQYTTPRGRVAANEGGEKLCARLAETNGPRLKFFRYSRVANGIREAQMPRRPTEQSYTLSRPKTPVWSRTARGPAARCKWSTPINWSRTSLIERPTIAELIRDPNLGRGNR